MFVFVFGVAAALVVVGLEGEKMACIFICGQKQREEEQAKRVESRSS